jgi:hypothetical protein
VVLVVLVVALLRIAATLFDHDYCSCGAGGGGGGNANAGASNCRTQQTKPTHTPCQSLGVTDLPCLCVSACLLCLCGGCLPG